jgi:hypothetical protein
MSYPASTKSNGTTATCRLIRLASVIFAQFVVSITEHFLNLRQARSKSLDCLGFGQTIAG